MNKIQRTFLFALLICMILLTGCASHKEQVKAPETLKITAELPENYPKALSKYKVDWYVQDDETARGIVQEVFVRLMEKRQSVQSE